jgi:hypothetical protein
MSLPIGRPETQPVTECSDLCAKIALHLPKICWSAKNRVTVNYTPEIEDADVKLDLSYVPPEGIIEIAATETLWTPEDEKGSQLAVAEIIRFCRMDYDLDLVRSYRYDIKPFKIAKGIFDWQQIEEVERSDAALNVFTSTEEEYFNQLLDAI